MKQIQLLPRPRYLTMATLCSISLARMIVALEKYADTLYPAVYDNFIEAAKNILTQEHKERLRSLLRFKFKRNPKYNFTVGTTCFDRTGDTWADTDAFKIVAQQVKYFKESREGVATMCKVMEDMREQSMKEGLAQGMKQGMKDTALRMLQAGKYALEEIAAVSGLSIEEVQKLSKTQMAQVPDTAKKQRFARHWQSV